MAKEFAGMWVTIKQDYKDATNSKKPAEKRFWGWFGDWRETTGIGDACKDVDSFLDKYFPGNVAAKGAATKKNLLRLFEYVDKYTDVKNTYIDKLKVEIEKAADKLEACGEKDVADNRKSLKIAEKRDDKKLIKKATEELRSAEDIKKENDAVCKAMRKKNAALDSMIVSLGAIEKLMISKRAIFMQACMASIGMEGIVALANKQGIVGQMKMVENRGKLLIAMCDTLAKTNVAKQEMFMRSGKFTACQRDFLAIVEATRKALGKKEDIMSSKTGKRFAEFGTYCSGSSPMVIADFSDAAKEIKSLTSDAIKSVNAAVKTAEKKG